MRSLALTIVAAALIAPSSALAAPGDVVLVSPPNPTGSGDTTADAVPATSGNGSYVAFLHIPDFTDFDGGNPGAQLFLRHMTAPMSIPVDVPTGSRNGQGYEAGSPALDDRGDRLVFVSENPDLSREDKDFDSGPAGTYPVRDVFVFERATRKVVLVSRKSGIKGAAANDDSNLPAISQEGRYVAFGTEANNLVSKRTFGHIVYGGVYVRDLQKKSTTLVSRADGRRGAPLAGFDPSIAAGGDRVAFTARAGPRHHRHLAIYIRDVRRGRTRVVSHAGDRDCVEPALAANGRRVAYTCKAEKRTNGIDQVYVTDLGRSRTSLVSARDGRRGRPGGGDSFDPSISANGRLVAFASYANDLGPKDEGRVTDVFVKDTRSGRVFLASAAGGRAGNGPSANPSLSGDGRYVSFESKASNLVPEDSDRGVSVFRYQLLP